MRRFAWRRAVASEEDEQGVFVEWLELRQVLFCHVPNGGNRNPITGAKLKRQGVQAGVPDILVFDQPTKVKAEDGSSYVGIAIEMKKRLGGRVRPSQKRWLSELRLRGWYTAICYGADEAIKVCQECGL